MILLDTDTFSLLMHGHRRVSEKVHNAEVNITVITRIEVLQGRFATILKSANADELLRAQHWLNESETYLARMTVVPIDSDAAAEFEKMRLNTRLKKIGRADLLIASIALAKSATLVTRNLKHFRLIPGLLLENWAD